MKRNMFFVYLTMISILMMGIVGCLLANGYFVIITKYVFNEILFVVFALVMVAGFTFFSIKLIVLYSLKYKIIGSILLAVCLSLMFCSHEFYTLVLENTAYGETYIEEIKEVNSHKIAVCKYEDQVIYLEQQFMFVYKVVQK